MLTDLTVVSAQPKPVSVGRSLPWASSQPRKCLQPHCRNVIHPGWQLDTCLPCLHLQQANHQPPVKAINLSRSHTRKGHHDLVDISRTQRLSNKVTPAFAAPLVPVPPPQAFPHRSIDGRSFPNTMIPHYNARGELFEVDEDGNVILDPQTLINTSDKGKVIDSRSPLEPGQKPAGSSVTCAIPVEQAVDSTTSTAKVVIPQRKRPREDGRRHNSSVFPVAMDVRPVPMDWPEDQVSPSTPLEMRVCESEGCYEMLPHDTKWPRCSSCSLRRWKSRRALRQDEVALPSTSPNNSVAVDQPEPPADSHVADTTGLQGSVEETPVNIILANATKGVESRSGIDARGEVAPHADTIPAQCEDQLLARSDGPSCTDPSDVDMNESLPPRTSSPVPDSDVEMSELSDLTSLLDSGESEVDLASNADETEARHTKQPSDGLTKTCSRKLCHNLTTNRWKLCQQCRERARQYISEKRNGLRPPSAHMHRSDGDSGSESESNLAVDPSLFVPSEYRRCNIKGCCNHVPPQVAYRWKLCQSCRRRTREYQRHRRGVSSQPNNAVGASGPDDRNKIPSSDQGRADSDDDSDVPLATKAARRSSVKSSPSRPLSGIMIRIKRPKKIVEPPVAKTPRGNQRSGNPDRPLAPLPVFQHLGTLLRTFRHHLSSFTQAQSHYLQFKLTHSGDAKGTGKAPSFDLKPMVFGFDGEYSVVADPSRGLGDVRNRVEDVKQQIASVGGWNFSRLGSFLVNGGAVVTRFSCLHEIVLQHPISPASSSETSGPVANTNPEELKGNEPAPPESSSDVNGTKTVSPQQVDGQPPCDPQMNVDLPPKASKSDGPPLPQTLEGSVPTAPGVPEPLLGGILVKRMTGELEVGVVADITHRFFPGQRIVVRFRLVG